MEHSNQLSAMYVRGRSGHACAVSSGSAATGTLLASSTFTLSCSGSGGTTTRSLTVDVIASPQTGLDFASNGSTGADIRFRFTVSAQ